MDIESFEQGCAHITARIEITSDNGESWTGTGFLFHAELPQAGSSITLLISNRHVLDSPQHSVSFILNRKRSDGGPDYGNTLSVRQHGFHDIYYEHPNPSVDLACVNASAVTGHGAFFRPLSKDFIEPLDEEKLHPGGNVLFVGYPDGRYDRVNNLPLVRSGTIASVPSMDYNGQGQIVLDAQVFKGSSGSPVFVPVDGRYRLLGVVTSTMISHGQLSPIRVGEDLHSVEVALGLGLIIKQRHVIELISGAVAKHMLSRPGMPPGLA